AAAATAAVRTTNIALPLRAGAPGTDEARAPSAGDVSRGGRDISERRRRRAVVLLGGGSAGGRSATSADGDIVAAEMRGKAAKGSAAGSGSSVTTRGGAKVGIRSEEGPESVTSSTGKAGTGAVGTGAVGTGAAPWGAGSTSVTERGRLTFCSLDLLGRGPADAETPGRLGGRAAL